MPLETATAIPKELRKLVRFGSGVGIEIGGKDLEVVAARVRPGRIRVLGRLAIRDFAARPAAEWGAEYARFLRSLGASYLSATVLLPPREVVVRQVALPGVANRDMEAAIRFQLDSLHPYGEDDVAWGWSPVGPGAAMVGIARRSTVDRYLQLFAAAGILVSSFTFQAAALHAAIALNEAGHSQGFVALGRASLGAVQVYGESASRPIFSAELEMPEDRAAALALSELRLPPETTPLKLEDALPKPDGNPVENDLSRNALPYATALAGAFPRLAPAANLLPPEDRRYGSRVMWVPTVALAVLLAAILGGAAAWSRVAERQYLDRLHAEIVRLTPQQQRAAALSRNAGHALVRAQWLDQYRAQTRRDLELLHQLTRLIESPAWTRSIDITRDSVRLQGETPQATALWKILDSSRIFRSSKLDNNLPSPTGGESFSIGATRESGK
jgi:type II secretory pathway component PulL